MKKIITFIIAVAFVLYGTTSFSQCSITFSYTYGSNGTVNFTSSVTGTGPFIYNWVFGDSAFSSAANPSHTYWYNTTYMVCAGITDSITGCMDSTCMSVTVSNATQVATCPGNANFTAAPIGTYTAFTNTAGNWVIDFGDGSPQGSSSGTGINHQYNFNGTYQVVVVAYSWFGSNYLPCDTDTQSVVVANVTCQAGFSYFVDTTNSNNTLYLQSQSFGASNNTWYINGSVVASNVDSVTTVLPAGVYNICLAITGPNACSDSTCQSVTLNPVNVSCTGVTFSYAPLSACDSYQFTVNNTGPPLTAVNWSLNGTWVSSLTSIPITFDFTSAQNDVYSQSVSVLAQGSGCASSQNFVFVNPSAFWINLDTTSGGGNTWYAYPQNPPGVTYELWDFGDGSTSTLQYPTHTYATAGFYTVCHTITVNGTCNYTYCVNQYFWRGTNSQGISYFVVMNTTGINENSAAGKIKVFPNPASDLITFALEKPAAGNVSLKIYNSAGSEVKAATIRNGAKAFILNLSSLPGGIYSYVISNMNGINDKGKICCKKVIFRYCFCSHEQ